MLAAHSLYFDPLFHICLSFGISGHDGRCVRPFRGGFKEYAHGVSHERDRTSQNDEADKHADDGVREKPSDV
jgi:hypothetical protein